MTDEYDAVEDTWASIHLARQIQQAVTRERERCLVALEECEGDVDFAVFLIKRGGE